MYIYKSPLLSLSYSLPLSFPLQGLGLGGGLKSLEVVVDTLVMRIETRKKQRKVKNKDISVLNDILFFISTSTLRF